MAVVSRPPAARPPSRGAPLGSGPTSGGATISVLVIDVGTSSVRAAIVRPDGVVEHTTRRPLPPAFPAPGLVEFDADQMAAAALDAARQALAAGGPVRGVGLTTQRASTVAWDPSTGRAVGPGIGWQDLRTAGACLELQSQGLRLSPSESATKYAWLLDTHDPGREGRIRLGTVDSWIAWHLTGGVLHVTDTTNAGVTGLLAADVEAGVEPGGAGGPYGAGDWNDALLDRLAIPRSTLPGIVASSGEVGPATALPGSPPICGVAGDQQASLVGQSCTRPGLVKATFGTGAMLDACVAERPDFAVRGEGGCFPIVAWSRAGRVTWGVEAIMLSAGTAVDWLVHDVGLLRNAAQSEEVAASCDDTGGAVMVPALNGLGTPAWDFGARGALLGVTRGVGRPQIVRAVLEGIAHRGADLLEAAERDTGLRPETLRVDGGMSANGVFLRALA
ncbi:MAG TPA: FGGY family carbohydrate kinase, partial [Acidimicrobiales bacterium]|nr:FGGY family carbohydrate kinase [Acidimicrobiales bacterium]